MKSDGFLSIAAALLAALAALVATHTSSAANDLEAPLCPFPFSGACVHRAAIGDGTGDDTIVYELAVALETAIEHIQGDQYQEGVDLLDRLVEAVPEWSDPY